MRDGYPLVDLHRHLEGSMRLETVLDLARQHNVELPAWTVDELRPHVQVMDQEPDLLGFLAKFDILRKVIADEEAAHRITMEAMEDAAREGIDYLELRFSPYFMAEAHDLDPMDVAEAVSHAAFYDRSGPPDTNLIITISRHYGPKIAELELEAALYFQHLGVVGLDLAGDEANYPATLFVEHFRKARDAGLCRTVHAGEAAGPESVRQAVVELGAQRIGHGVRAIEDPEVVDLLAERNITLECCLTSNLQTSTVTDLTEHPLPAFLERGVPVTLNTDDPSISGIDLPHEYEVAERMLGLDRWQLQRIQENAANATFTGEDGKLGSAQGEVDLLGKPFP